MSADRQQHPRHRRECHSDIGAPPRDSPVGVDHRVVELRRMGTLDAPKRCDVYVPVRRGQRGVCGEAHLEALKKDQKTRSPPATR